MTIYKFIIFLPIFFLISCRSTYRLSEDDFGWMPYKGNETLVFNSNNGNTDTIFFLKKDTLIAYPEAQALNGKTYVVVRILERQREASSVFMELKKSKDKKARLHFNLSTKNAAFFRITGVRIDSLSHQKPTSLITKAKTYHDVFVIEDDENGQYFKQRSNYVAKLYWSKSEGLIRYDKQDSVYWELTKRYSP